MTMVDEAATKRRLRALLNRLQPEMRVEIIDEVIAKYRRADFKLILGGGDEVKDVLELRRRLAAARERLGVSSTGVTEIIPQRQTQRPEGGE